MPLNNDETWWDNLTKKINEAGRMKARRIYLRDVKKHLPDANYQEELKKFKEDFPGVDPQIGEDE